jgi:hypothetical protein
MRIAQGAKYISDEEFAAYWEMYDEIARMLTGLMKYLDREDRPRRG